MQRPHDLFGLDISGYGYHLNHGYENQSSLCCDICVIGKIGIRGIGCMVVYFADGLFYIAKCSPIIIIMLSSHNVMPLTH